MNNTKARWARSIASIVLDEVEIVSVSSAQEGDIVGEAGSLTKSEEHTLFWLGLETEEIDGYLFAKSVDG